jgi:hypothetical protein
MSNPWIPLTVRLPRENQVVIIGHSTGKWVIQDVMFLTGKFILREQPSIGGAKGYMQKDAPKLTGFQASPTHWMEVPNAPI